MKPTKPIQIFKPGTHTAMSGAALSFSEADLAATAKAYDPAKHEAPLVCGHPRHDAPAYGWVGSLSFRERAGGEGAFLEAAPAQVNADFAELVAKGSFKKISASFYAPDSPSNPVPGVYYLRHVGFLGAMPPAVKGMRDASFADNEQGIVEFGDYDDRVNAGLWRKVREWFIGEKGQEVADRVVPDYDINTLEEYARREDPADPAGAMPVPAFIEPQHPSPQSSPASGRGGEREGQFLNGDSPMTPEEKARMAALEAENARLKADAASFAEAEKKRKVAAIHADNAAFCEALVKEGRMLPANLALNVATLDFMASQEKTVEFGEGDAKKPLLDEHKAMLKAQPVQVEFGEKAKARDAARAVEFAAAAGCIVDTGQLEQHAQILAYQEKHGCTFEVAMTKFNQSQPNQ